VVPIKLPPLRKRPEDIPLLANHFLTYYWQRHRQMGDPPAASSPTPAIEFLRSRAVARQCA
jgi:transcriptional regulator with GAF, ATPase, and Fis domain